MTDLHKFHMDPHAHVDAVWNTKHGMKSAKIDVKINTSLLIRSKSKAAWLRKIFPKFLCFIFLFYLAGLNVYIYCLHNKLSLQQSDLSNTFSAVDHLIKINDYASTQLNELKKEITSLKHFSHNWENFVSTITVENLPNLVGRSYNLLYKNLGVVDDVSPIFVGGNQSLIEYRQKRGTRRSGNNKRCRCKEDGKRDNRTKQPEFAAAHFLCTHLQILYTEAGIVGPWFSPVYSNEELSRLGVKIIDDDRMVEVTKKGMYFIYAQIHYFSKNRTNSFSLNTISVRSGRDTQIAVCSKDNMRSSETEISCHTSLVYFLDTEDRLYIRLRDTGRKINFHEGYSFFGLFPISAKLPT